jgi:hypothetical protein
VAASLSRQRSRPPGKADPKIRPPRREKPR